MLLHHLKHNKMLHKQVVLVSFTTDPVPYVSAQDSVRIRTLEHGFFEVTARYGFMQQPPMETIYARCHEAGIHISPTEASFFLGHLSFRTTGRTRMPLWQKRLYVYLHHNARPAFHFFGIPPNRVVELGEQVEL